MKKKTRFKFLTFGFKCKFINKYLVAVVFELATGFVLVVPQEVAIELVALLRAVVHVGFGDDSIGVAVVVAVGVVVGVEAAMVVAEAEPVVLEVEVEPNSVVKVSDPECLLEVQHFVVFEDTTDFVAVLVVYLELGTVVDTVVLGFDLALDSNFAVRVVVGNSVFVDYFEAIAVDFALAWFVRLAKISDHSEVVATVVAVVLVAVARVVAKFVNHVLVGFQPEKTEAVAVGLVEAIAVDYFLVGFHLDR